MLKAFHSSTLWLVTIKVFFIHPHIINLDRNPKSHHPSLIILAICLPKNRWSLNWGCSMMGNYFGVYHSMSSIQICTWVILRHILRKNSVNLLIIPFQTYHFYQLSKMNIKSHNLTCATKIIEMIHTQILSTTTVNRRRQRKAKTEDKIIIHY